MPLLNGRKMGTAAQLHSARAAEIQLRMMQRDGHAGVRASARSSDPGAPGTPIANRLGSGATAYAVRSSIGSGELGFSASRVALRQECGNPSCSGGWTPPWRSRKYPFFEDRWGCSERCMLAMIRMAVARELGEGVPQKEVEDGAGQHRHRIPLGLVLLGQGWITHPQLRKALEMQRLKGKGRIGDWLVSECGLRSEWITRGLSVQWNCPVLTMDGFSPETMARAIPKTFIEEYGILPVRVAARRILYVGFQDHLDAASAFAVEQISGLRAECGVIGEERFRKAKEQVLDCRFLEMKRTSVADRDSLARCIGRVIDQAKPTASRLVRLHRYYWLRLWNEDENTMRSAWQIPAAGEAADHLFTIE